MTSEAGGPRQTLEDFGPEGTGVVARGISPSQNPLTPNANCLWFLRLPGEMVHNPPPSISWQ